MLATIGLADLGTMATIAAVVGGFIVWNGRQQRKALDEHMTREEAAADRLDHRLDGIEGKLDGVRSDVSYLGGSLGVDLPSGRH